MGSFLLQLAVAAGLDVVAAGRSIGHETMRSLGAKECVDYADENFIFAIGDVDAVADLVGGNLLNRVVPRIQPRGSIASIATPRLDLDPVLDRNLSFHGVLVHTDGRRNRRLASQLASQTLRPIVSKVLPLAQAAAARQTLEDGHSGGKIVLDVARWHDRQLQSGI